VHYARVGLYRGRNVALLILLTKKMKTKSDRVKQCLQKKSDTLSHKHTSLTAELRVSSDVDLRNYLRMTEECFKVWLNFLKLHTEKLESRRKQE
jgi:hypothetical protein